MKGQHEHMIIDHSPRKRGRAAIKDRTRIMERDGGVCQLCQRCVATQVDHIIPLFKGGSDSDENKQCICDQCHNRKTITERGGKFNAGVDVNGIPRDSMHHWNK